jgi:hypothetical protein
MVNMGDQEIVQFSGTPSRGARFDLQDRIERVGKDLLVRIGALLQIGYIFQSV